jgi:hypothetical protein
MPLHERGDFLLLLVHHGQQRKFFLAGIIAGNAVVFLFLLVDFLADGERIEIHRDGVIEQAQAGEPVDDSWVSHLRPARQRDDGMVTAIHEETEIGLSRALAVPAIFLNGKLRIKTVNRVVVEPFGQ